jgi:hypothetical protein
MLFVASTDYQGSEIAGQLRVTNIVTTCTRVVDQRSSLVTMGRGAARGTKQRSNIVRTRAAQRQPAIEDRFEEAAGLSTL